MQKGRTKYLFLFVAVVFIFGFATDVPAFDFLDGKLRVHGFVRNQTGVRLKDHIWYDPIIDGGIAGGAYVGPRVENMRQESGKISTCRSTLQLESEFDITPELMLSVTVRGFYDAKWDLDSNINIYGGRGYDEVTGDAPTATGLPTMDLNNKASNIDTEPYGENKQADIDLREYYLNWVGGDFNVKIGRMQVAWGEADAIRIADIINPMDFTVDFTTTTYGMDWEDTRIPLRMIDVTYIVPESRYQFEVELVSVLEWQGNVKADAYGETFYLFPQQTDFSYMGFDILLGPDYFNVPMGGITTSSHWSAFTDNVLDAHDDADHTWQGGVRLRGVFGGWDTHMFYYHQRWQDPIFSSNSGFNFPMFMPWDLREKDLGFEAEYPRVDTVGGTVNYFFDPWGLVFRGECGYVFDEPFSGMNQGLVSQEQWDSGDYDFKSGPGIIDNPNNGQWADWFYHEPIKKDTVHIMTGFDRPTWIPFLNRTTTFFITGQFYYKKIFDYDDTVKGQQNEVLLDTMMGKDSRSDHKTLASLKINTKYMDDTIEPDVLVVWDINGHSGFVKPCLAWKPTYDWRFEIGALYVWADGYKTGPFGYIQDADLLYGVIEYKF